MHAPHARTLRPRAVPLNHGNLTRPTYLAFPRTAAFDSARAQYNTLFNQMVRSGELLKLGVRNGVLVPTVDLAADLGPAGCK